MTDFRDLANTLRALSMDAVDAANSGHPGAPLGMADAASVLYRNHLKFDASAPDWPDRDRVVFSNGHASALLYALLHVTGYADMTSEQLRNFRQLGAITAGHPEYGHAAGIEVTTGPLGQGLASAVGMAIAERILAESFGDGIVDHRTFVFAGDGCLQEGVGQEAISLAGHLGLGKLVVLYDDNGITIDGATSVSFSDDVTARFAACGWHTISCDGHDHAALDAALSEARTQSDKPTLIAMKTVIGFGSPNRAGTAGVHGAPLGADENAATRAQLGWEAAPFEVPAALAEAWREIGRAGTGARKDWTTRLQALPESECAEFERRMARALPDEYSETYQAARSALAEAPQKVATRKASQNALAALAPALPELVGGSADLTGSNLTRVPAVDSQFSADAGGRYIGWGVREFAMAAGMNGISVHGGLIPYGGTFLVFSDYARNAIRLSALMEVGTIYVMTHDSIGLGEDGPTHQPVEHLASLRAIPGLSVFRPADAVETLECWDIALRNRTRPSLLALSRQGVAQLRTEAGTTNRSELGAYVLHAPEGERDITLLATGTEVTITLDAARKLAGEGIAAAVVSMPSWDLFEAQPDAYRNSVLGTAPRVAIEAASPFGWTRYVARESDVVGVHGFGASGKAEDLYAHFKITNTDICAKARHMLNKD